jgi:peroxiredoxin Q/BCP
MFIFCWAAIDCEIATAHFTRSLSAMLRFVAFLLAGLTVLNHPLVADPLAVYFYPKAGTSGCTAEACSLRDSYDKLQADGLQIIGISRDTPDAQKHFQSEYKLPFTLVADTDGRVAEAFGVPMMLGGLVPYASRQSFLVKDDKIAWNSLHAQTTGSAAEIQKALDGLR